ncbi:hypothetical protein HOE425_332410 [Hoeflea sp. EC-HK425]|nr:hypothetical protein HOE425_332410 [Hoeflea sp. EC-HK425]
MVAVGIPQRVNHRKRGKRAFGLIERGKHCLDHARGDERARRIMDEDLAGACVAEGFETQAHRLRPRRAAMHRGKQPPVIDPGQGRFAQGLVVGMNDHAQKIDRIERQERVDRPAERTDAADGEELFRDLAAEAMAAAGRDYKHGIQHGFRLAVLPVNFNPRFRLADAEGAGCLRAALSRRPDPGDCAGDRNCRQSAVMAQFLIRHRAGLKETGLVCIVKPRLRTNRRARP